MLYFSLFIARQLKTISHTVSNLVMRNSERAINDTGGQLLTGLMRAHKQLAQLILHVSNKPKMITGPNNIRTNSHVRNTFYCF